MARRLAREWRPALFRCDEYQSFLTVGEEDPAGDEKAFTQTRQSGLDPHRGHAVDLDADGNSPARRGGGPAVQEGRAAQSGQSPPRRRSDQR